MLNVRKRPDCCLGFLHILLLLIYSEVLLTFVEGNNHCCAAAVSDEATPERAVVLWLYLSPFG